MEAPQRGPCPIGPDGLSGTSFRFEKGAGCVLFGPGPRADLAPGRSELRRFFVWGRNSKLKALFMAP